MNGVAKKREKNLTDPKKKPSKKSLFYFILLFSFFSFFFYFTFRFYFKKKKSPLPKKSSQNKKKKYSPKLFFSPLFFVLIFVLETKKKCISQISVNSIVALLFEPNKVQTSHIFMLIYFFLKCFSKTNIQNKNFSFLHKPKKATKNESFCRRQG